MSTRKVYGCTLNQPINFIQHGARVYYNSDDREFTVKFYQNGVEMSLQRYFTDDKEDAIGTARRALFEIGKQQIAVCTNFGTLPSA